MGPVKAVLLDVPESLLAERARIGADMRDECWEGVLHMVPQPFASHQRLASELVLVLGPIAKARGLEPWFETALYRPGRDDDHRVPDQLYARPQHEKERGLEGPVEVALEIRSPGDETYDKLGFYAEVGVGELLVVHPADRRVELFALTMGRLEAVAPNVTGALICEGLGVRFRTVEGPRLLLAWDGGSATA